MAKITINANACVNCGHNQKNHASNKGCDVEDCDCKSLGVF